MQNLSIISAAYGSKTACINTHVIKNPSQQASTTVARMIFFRHLESGHTKECLKRHSYDVLSDSLLGYQKPNSCSCSLHKAGKLFSTEDKPNPSG